LLDESYIPTIGSQAEPLDMGRILSHNNKPIGRIRTLLKFLGPAFIVSVAYIDPGNLKLEHICCLCDIKLEGQTGPLQLNIILQVKDLQYQVDVGIQHLFYISTAESFIVFYQIK
jgi:hypothetical protein